MYVDFSSQAFARIYPFGPLVFRKLGDFVNEVITPLDRVDTFEMLEQLHGYQEIADCIAETTYVYMWTEAESINPDKTCFLNGMGYLIRFLSNFEETLLFTKFDEYLKNARKIPQCIFGAIRLIRSDLNEYNPNFKHLVGFESTEKMLLFSNKMLEKLPLIENNDDTKTLVDEMVNEWQQKKFFPISKGNKDIFSRHLSDALSSLKKITSKYELCN